MSVVMRFAKEPRFGSFASRHQKPNLGSWPLETRIRAAVRRCIADEIQRLVDMLDEYDGDADDEGEPDAEDLTDDAAEPSLGWPNPMGEHLDVDHAFHRLHGAGAYDDDDRELDEADGLLEDAGDEREAEENEPSLGWPEYDENASAIDRTT